MGAWGRGDGRWRRGAPVALLAAAAAAVGLATPAQATFPGTNGMLSGTICNGQVTTINPDGTGIAALTNDDPPPTFDPVDFSPDGNRLLLSRYAGPGTGALADFDLATLDLATGAIAKIHEHPAQEAFATWSPDGARVAFESNRDTPAGQLQNEIYILTLATGDVVRRSNNADYDGPLDWSPLGDRLVVQRANDTGGSSSDDGLFLVDPGTGSSTTVVDLPTVDERSPSWSPDGSRIAYVGPDASGDYNAIWTVKPDGSENAPLTGAVGINDSDPVWAPDGTAIAFNRSTGGSQNIVITAFPGGGGVRQVTPFSGASPGRACLEDWQACTAGTTRCVSRSPATGGGGAGSPPGGAPPSGSTDSDGDGLVDPNDACPQIPASTPTGCPGGTTGDDILRGTAAADTICGLLGNDTIDGLAGNDTLYGDACEKRARISAAGSQPDGNDKLSGSEGNDRLYGAGGRDSLAGGAGADRLFGGSGNDTLKGEAGKDSLDGGAGNDKLTGGADVNRYKAGAGNDTVSARNRRKETVDCGAGKRDRATVDRNDKVKGCEKVTRR